MSLIASTITCTAFKNYLEGNLNKRIQGKCNVIIRVVVFFINGNF